MEGPHLMELFLVKTPLAWGHRQGWVGHEHTDWIIPIEVH